ncbi:hypothetical protein ACOME3_000840 [Neoechinorhynchus agilis]
MGTLKDFFARLDRRKLESAKDDEFKMLLSPQSGGTFQELWNEPTEHKTFQIAQDDNSNMFTLGDSETHTLKDASGDAFKKDSDDYLISSKDYSFKKQQEDDSDEHADHDEYIESPPSDSISDAPQSEEEEEKTIVIGGTTFYLKEMLGKTLMNKVHRAVISGTEVSVALKQCIIACKSRKERKARHRGYVTEVLCHQLLQASERVINLHGFHFGGQQCLARMVFELGIGSVPEFIETHKSRKIRIQLWYSMVIAVNDVHLRGIWHLDIKPDNFIFGADGVVKLIDFGFSLPANESYRYDYFRGTIRYMSPEVLCRAPFGKYSSKCDIWALGCILYEMVYGRPFLTKKILIKSRHSYDKIFHLMRNLTFEPLENQDLLDILRKCMDLVPSRRPTTDEILKHPLFTKIAEKTKKTSN